MQIVCSLCRQLLHVPAAPPGRKLRCPKCNRVFTVDEDDKTEIIGPRKAAPPAPPAPADDDTVETKRPRLPPRPADDDEETAVG